MLLIEKMLAAAAGSSGEPSDFFLYAWGDNRSFYLGDPTLAGELYSWTAISSGNYHTGAIRSDGTLWTWGVNSSGALGTGDTTNQSSPVQVGSDNSWTFVQAGGGLSPGVGTTAAIRSDGALFTWGKNDLGQLGLNDRIDRSSPVQLGANSWTLVRNQGDKYTLAINNLGLLYSWGRGAGGGLGISGFNGNRSSPSQVGSASYIALSSFADSVFAVKNDNSLWYWGTPGGTTTPGVFNMAKYFLQATAVVSPVSVGSDTDWLDIRNSDYHIQALKTDYSLYTWGLNNHGQTAAPNFPNLSWNTISIGTGFAAGITSDGSMYAWGGVYTTRQLLPESGHNSVLGQGVAGLSSTDPVKIDGSWNAVAAGDRHIVAIANDGGLYTWGHADIINEPVLGDNVSPFNRKVYSPQKIGNDSWTAVSASQNHSAAIRADGRLFTWGSNGRGQLGDNTTITRSSPVAIGTNSWIAVAAGGIFDTVTTGTFDNHTLAIRADGTLWSWGNNDKGQLGIPGLISRSSPTQVGSANNWVKVAAGKLHSVAINSSNELYHFGDNTQGQLGIDSLSSVQSWSMISSSVGHTLAINSQGKLFAWGLNEVGQLGINKRDTTVYNQPVQVGNDNWSYVLVPSRSNSVAIKSDGSLWGWGLNKNYVYSNASTGTLRSSPSLIGSGPYSKVVASVESSTYQAFGALRTNGQLYVWGTSLNSQAFGTGNTIPTSILLPTLQPGGFTYSDIEIETNNGWGIRSSDGRLYCWGTNTNGVRGVNLEPFEWTTVSTGSRHSMGIMSDGTLWGWGDGLSGRTGLGSTDYNTPTKASALSNWTQVSAGSEHTLALNSDGQLFAFGRNNYGQLGDGTRTSRTTTSTQIAVGTSFIAIAAGVNWSAAIASNNSLMTWGNNFYGQLGHGDTTHRSIPAAVAGITVSDLAIGKYTGIATDLSTGRVLVWGSASGPVGVEATPSEWRKISVNGSSALGIKRNGTLWAWGFNNYGQLGLNSTLSYAADPQQIGTDTFWSDGHVVMGNQFAAAVTEFRFGVGREIFIWGKNNKGQLGLGDTVNRSSPTLLATHVPEFGDPSIDLAFDHAAMVVDTSGSGRELYTWGNKSYGKLGVDDDAGFSTFYNTISHGSGWLNVTVSDFNTWATKSDGTIWAIGGAGGFGMLGDNTSGVNRSSPIQIASGLTNAKIATVDFYNGYPPADGTQVYAFGDQGILAWGKNSKGSLGTDDTIHRSSPVSISANSPEWMHKPSLEATIWFAGGDIYFTGFNGYGGGDVPFGTGFAYQRSSPTILDYVSYGPSVTGYKEPTTALFSGTLYPTFSFSNPWYAYVWSVSYGGSGLLGIPPKGIGSSLGTVFGTGAVDVSTPQSFQNFRDIGDSWRSISAGESHAAGVTSNGHLYTWGRNNNGQLGLSDTDNRLTPTRVGYGTTWQEVSVGGNHTMARLTNAAAGRDDVYVWGSNYAGQLGQNNRISTSSPVLLQSGRSFRTTGDGAFGRNPGLGSHTIVIDVAGYAWATGTNANGELGTGAAMGLNAARSSPVAIQAAVDNFSVPVALDTTTSWTAVDSDGIAAYAIRNDGRLFAWGRGIPEGNPFVDRSSPVSIGTDSWTFISTGLSIAHAIRSDGKLFGWGANYDGALGDNTIINRSSPVVVGGNSSWTFVDSNGYWTGSFTGNRVSTAIASDGLLYMWGNTTDFRHGFRPSSRSQPVLFGNTNILPSDNLNWIDNPNNKLTGIYTDVAVNPVSDYTIALKNDGSAIGLGRNNLGQLADNTIIDRSSPVSIGGGVNWRTLAAGASSAAGISAASNSAYVWGSSNSLGLGLTVSISRSAPVLLGDIPVNTYKPTKLDNSSWVSIGTDRSTSVAVKSDGSLFAWGHNALGQLGLNDAVSRSSPVQVGSRSFKFVDITSSQTFAVDGNDIMFAWGDNSSGALGKNDTVSRSSPTQVGGEGSVLSSPVQISSSSWSVIKSANNTTLAITDQGLLYGWGRNNVGQLGLGDVIDRSIPVQIGTSSWASIATNGYVSAAIRNDGAMFVMGGNDHGALGLNDTVSRSSPVQVGILSWASVSAGDANTAPIGAIRSDGLLFTWGRNSWGTQGLNNVDILRSSPTQVGASSWSYLDIGHLSVAAIQTDGSLWTWGYNSNGLLGDSGASRSSPVQIGSDTNWTSVSVGRSHMHAIKSNNTLWGWGQNTLGQIGVNSTTNALNPVQIDGSWESVSNDNADASVFAVSKTKKLYAWGENSSGKLGLEDTVNRSSPTQIGLDANWVIAENAGSLGAFGIK